MLPVLFAVRLPIVLVFRAWFFFCFHIVSVFLFWINVRCALRFAFRASCFTPWPPPSPRSRLTKLAQVRATHAHAPTGLLLDVSRVEGVVLGRDLGEVGYLLHLELVAHQVHDILPLRSRVKVRVILAL